MSEPRISGSASPERAARVDPVQAIGSSPAPRPPARRGQASAVGSTNQPTALAWPTVVIVILIVAVVGSGLLATHQVLTYGSLVPSISGGWYGAYRVVEPQSGQYASGYSFYVLFAAGQGNHLSATTSSCTTPSNGLYTQAAIPGLPYTGTLNDSKFKMASQPGDVENDLAWVGTYSTDKIHIDFYPFDAPTSRTAYANLQRGTYSDFLATCKVK